MSKMKEFNIENLTFKQICNYISVMNKLVKDKIIKFNKNKASCTICYDKASEVIEKQNEQYKQENKELKEKINKAKDFLKDEKDKSYVHGGDVLIVSIIDYDYLINILEGDK